MARQLQNKTERINSKINGAADHTSIQLLAYQTYQEKGGSDLENWLEAERILKNGN